MTLLPDPSPGSPFARFRDALIAMPTGDLKRRDVLDGRFELASGAGFAVHYAPFDHVNADARLVVVGLTPGWEQTKLAFETARDRLRAGEDDERTLRAVKRQASFAGMRGRLAQWLDGVGVSRALCLTTAAELFDRRAELLHSTSAVRYPVVCDGDANWSGANPAISEPLLRDLVRSVLAPELGALPHALVVPLGVAVQTCLRDLVDRGELDPGRCLFGFPHPSGADATGPRRYAEARPRLQALVTRWAQLPAPHERAAHGTRPGLEAVLPDRATLERLVLEALASLGGQAERHSIKRRAVALGEFAPHQRALPGSPIQARQPPDQLSDQLDGALNALHRQRRVRRVGPGDWALP